MPGSSSAIQGTRTGVLNSQSLTFHRTGSYLDNHVRFFAAPVQNLAYWALSKDLDLVISLSFMVQQVPFLQGFSHLYMNQRLKSIHGYGLQKRNLPQVGVLSDRANLKHYQMLIVWSNI